MKVTIKGIDIYQASLVIERALADFAGCGCARFVVVLQYDEDEMADAQERQNQ